VDPEFTPGYPSTMTLTWMEALASREMAAYRQVLTLPNQDEVRVAVIDDLSTYYGLDPDEWLNQCVNRKAWSVNGSWAQDRPAREKMHAPADRSLTSWSFARPACRRFGTVPGRVIADHRPAEGD
jgi:hypothetical protein